MRRAPATFGTAIVNGLGSPMPPVGDATVPLLNSVAPCASNSSKRPEHRRPSDVPKKSGRDEALTASIRVTVASAGKVSSMNSPAAPDPAYQRRIRQA